MQRFIAKDEVKIAPNRQRREFDIEALNELRESIEARGLLHPIVLRIEGEHYYLVAGERRYRAICDLYDLGGIFSFDGSPVIPDLIPYTNLGDLDELEREEAELDENLRRQDLTWQEHAAATARLSSLRKKQATAASAPPPTLEEIATEVRGTGVGRAREAIRREIIVAKNLDRPEVKNAKNMDEAYKALKKVESLEKNRELAEVTGKTFSTASHTLLNEDCTKWLVTCPDSSFDVILTDPPYGMNADNFGDSGGLAGEHAYKDDTDTFIRCCTALADESYRITKPQAHLYLFCDLDNFHWLKGLFHVCGWEVHRTPLVWHKPNGNRIPWPEYGPQRKYELCLYAVKGKRPTTCVAPDVFSHAADANLGHGAQKPVSLFTDLLKRSIRPGDSVLDCFGGTGPILPAAHLLQCKATYIELDPASYGIALNRLKTLEA